MWTPSACLFCRPGWAACLASQQERHCAAVFWSRWESKTNKLNDDIKSQSQCTSHYNVCVCVFQTTLQQSTGGWGSYFQWWSLFSTRMGVLSSVYRWVLSPALIPVGLLCITYHRSTKLMNNIPHLLFLCFVRWRMNMAVISLVTTTTCVTFTSCSGLTWATTWCSSPQMDLGSASSSVAR